jgi:hypothetical protein
MESAINLNVKYRVGVDVGSTTVKAVVVDEASNRPVWRDYVRHETRQSETLLGFLRRMEAEVEIRPENSRIFVTGSGGNALAELIGARFVQEVLATSLAWRACIRKPRRSWKSAVRMRRSSSSNSRSLKAGPAGAPDVRGVGSDSGPFQV